MNPDSPHLAAQPVIGGLVEFYWSIFWTLHGGRQAGERGYQAIQLSEIVAYCALAGIADADERMVIVRFMQDMDRAFLEVMAKRAERERKR